MSYFSGDTEIYSDYNHKHYLFIGLRHYFHIEWFKKFNIMFENDIFGNDSQEMNVLRGGF